MLMMLAPWGLKIQAVSKICGSKNQSGAPKICCWQHLGCMMSLLAHLYALSGPNPVNCGLSSFLTAFCPYSQHFGGSSATLAHHVNFKNEKVASELQQMKTAGQSRKTCLNTMLTALWMVYRRLSTQNPKCDIVMMMLVYGVRARARPPYKQSTQLGPHIGAFLLELERTRPSNPKSQVSRTPCLTHTSPAKRVFT